MTSLAKMAMPESQSQLKALYDQDELDIHGFNILNGLVFNLVSLPK